MRIDEVITQTIVAIYQAPALATKLFLKGGSAIRLFENVTSRLSIDADFSLEGSMKNEERFFKAIESRVSAHFKKSKLQVIDFHWGKRPKERRKEAPRWWGGWFCEFKLISFEHRHKSKSTRSRIALVPEGANSPKIVLDISEHEYCGEKRTKNIQGVAILGYSLELLVLEKIRAICQQHPTYPYRLNKNRARDFYDIYELTVNVDDDFVRRCTHHIDKVFKAKEVSLNILNSLWTDEFIDDQRRGFDEVKNTIRGKVQTFDLYVEHLRFLIKRIYPAAMPP